MKTIPARLQKITSKGQITLPVAWRDRVGASAILVASEGDSLRISLTRFEQDEEEYSVFDAICDNNRKGLPAEDVVRILKKLRTS